MSQTMEFVNLPATIADEDALEELLSRPPRWLCDKLGELQGDIIVLDVGGKVGPTLACMAKRAVPDKTVYGAARFSDPEIRKRLTQAHPLRRTCRQLLTFLAPAPVARRPEYRARKDPPMPENGLMAFWSDIDPDYVLHRKRDGTGE